MSTSHAFQKRWVSMICNSSAFTEDGSGTALNIPKPCLSHSPQAPPPPGRPRGCHGRIEVDHIRSEGAPGRPGSVSVGDRKWPGGDGNRSGVGPGPGSRVLMMFLLYQRRAAQWFFKKRDRLRRCGTVEPNGTSPSKNPRTDLGRKCVLTVWTLYTGLRLCTYGRIPFQSNNQSLSIDCSH